MITKTDRKAERIRRHKRVRTKISGTAECPRLCVYRSNTNLYAQIIDDEKQVTLTAASTLDKEVKTKKAAEKNITTVVFDRGGYIYHGVVKELAEAAREGGLKF